MKFIRLITEAALLLYLTVLVCVHAPGWHRRFIRNYVADKTVVITFTDPARFNRGGGTGVQVQLPHGGNAILTNAHVCAIKDSDGNVMIESPTLQRPMPRHVLEISGITDLCLIEGIPGVSGIRTGSKVYPGDMVYSLGHPQLLPSTMSSGEVIGDMAVDVFDHEIIDEKDSDCSQPKNRIEDIETFFGPVKVCLTHIVATYTTIPTFPGNSGSAAFDSHGGLVGLVFASDNETHWGCLVTLKDINEFLGPH